jgi:hypothetical protein
MKAGELIAQIAQAAGIDVTDKKFAELFGVGIEVPTEIAEGFQKNYLTIEEAKNNVGLKKYYFAQALDPLDKNIPGMLEKFGLAGDDADIILQEKSTFKKVENLVNKIAELEKKKAGTPNKGKEEEYAKQINELNQKLSDFAKEKQSEIERLRSDYEQQFIDADFRAMLASQPLPGQFDKDVELNMARLFVEKELAEKNAKIIRKDGKIKLVAKDDENMLIFEAGKELDLSSLTAGALARNKFIKVSDPKPQPRHGQQPIQNDNQNPSFIDAAAELEAISNKFGMAQ